MKINPMIYGVLVLALFMGVILGSQALGAWSTSGKVNADGKAIQPSAADVNSIKGWMTLEQVSKTYHVTLDQIVQEFSLPVDTLPSAALKDLESETFDVTALRTWLSEQQKKTP